MPNFFNLSITLELSFYLYSIQEESSQKQVYLQIPLPLSKDTLFNYISHLEDAYTLFSLPIYRNSIKEENRNPKKIYAIDNGFKKIYDYAISEDMSKLYENIVFLHLRRQSQDIYYYKIK